MVNNAGVATPEVLISLVMQGVLPYSDMSTSSEPVADFNSRTLPESAEHTCCLLLILVL